MRVSGVAYGAAALLVLVGAAPVPRGAPATLDIINASDDTLECHAIAGHWYGFDLGEIESGGRRTIALLYDRASGMVAKENVHGRPVPLQSVYCGTRGDAWRSRAVLPLLDALQAEATVTCRYMPAGLDCR